MRLDRRANLRRKRLSKGLRTRLHAKVQKRLKKQLDLCGGQVGNRALKLQNDARSRSLLIRIQTHTRPVDLNVTQEAVLHIRSAVDVEDDAIGAHLHIRNLNAVALVRR